MLDMGPYYITDLVNLLGPGRERQRASPTPHAVRARWSPASRSTGTRIPGRGRDPCRRDAGIRERRGGLDRDELRRRPAPARADRDLRRRGGIADRARPQPFRRRGRDRRPRPSDWRDDADRRTAMPTAITASIGVADMAHAIRAEPAASRQRRARVPRARGDGGVPDLRPTTGRRVDDREPRRSGRRLLPPALAIGELD